MAGPWFVAGLFETPLLAWLQEIPSLNDCRVYWGKKNLTGQSKGVGDGVFCTRAVIFADEGVDKAVSMGEGLCWRFGLCDHLSSPTEANAESDLAIIAHPSRSQYQYRVEIGVAHAEIMSHMVAQTWLHHGPNGRRGSRSSGERSKSAWLPSYAKYRGAMKMKPMMRAKHRLNFDRAMAYSVAADKRTFPLFLWAREDRWTDTHLRKRYCVCDVHQQTCDSGRENFSCREEIIMIEGKGKNREVERRGRGRRRGLRDWFKRLQQMQSSLMRVGAPASACATAVGVWFAHCAEAPGRCVASLASLELR
ncbi:uncharacterized protein TRIVIDRAFT_200320 [Trichoderma virens Gv29-8]|uniref:Uncharacterized protein n=1 Tax=Hypocrea virens (strain Gv29-8 / FGSC 10586) TaxID=413071 RepID=G9MQ53_HYPVG|nr:uncharacterized protein TRIVIDRAFT_200320 [Trichoderma virens Gv29-8]EHK24001.1 hypothetical protein TRIVIDRAFT_200320 [Trichoderma virens Gv29-8]